MADKTVDPVIEKPWQKALRLQQQQVYRKSKYPPITIEPFPYERQRLSGDGMTEADRALRKQWIQDQVLSPNEPRYVPETRPRNIFRRIYNKPMDILFEALRPTMGTYNAGLARVTVPRILMSLGFVYVAYYQLKYHPNDWTKVGGFTVYTNKPAILDGETPYQEKEPGDFAARGFKSRSVLLDGKTSAVMN